MSHQEPTIPNQSRPRTHPGPSAGGATAQAETAKPKINNAAAYQGPDLDENSIRLLEISPAEHDTSPLVCTLREATFSSRPVFDALSYMWGPDVEGDKEIITLNGCPFEVRRNLRDALRFFRRRTPPHQAFWIDAVCINQGDRAEKTRQLRIMDQIYFRARTVVVWLGAGKYAELQREMAGEGGGEVEKPEDAKLKDERVEDDKPHDNISMRNFSRQQELVRYLRTDPYWSRLWILQAIGRARELQVCFGEQVMSWADFVHFLTMHNSDGKDGPLRLNRLLREERYHGSHTLKRLLEEHQDAQCFEPLDKVYGLVGLAVDAIGFPMDYSKSLYEVWKDTMEFMNRRKLFLDEAQIIPTGALLKKLLMTNHRDPLSQVFKEQSMNKDDSEQLITDHQSDQSFCLETVPLGCVMHIGPSANEFVSSPKQVSGWLGAIQQLFPASELGQARREHDMLLDALLRSDESEVEKTCFNRPSTVIWQEETGGSFGRYQGRAQDYIASAQGTVSPTSQALQTAQQAPARLAPVQPQLYLVRSKDGPTTRKMGVASRLIEPRDLICGVRSSRRALLVRVVEADEENASVRVFGTALATEDLCGTAEKCDYAKRWTSLREGGAILKAHVDAGTIFTLLE